jgi:hypothetical protein
MLFDFWEDCLAVWWLTAWVWSDPHAPIAEEDD